LGVVGESLDERENHSGGERGKMRTAPPSPREKNWGIASGGKERGRVELRRGIPRGEGETATLIWRERNERWEKGGGPQIGGVGGGWVEKREDPRWGGRGGRGYVRVFWVVKGKGHSSSEKRRGGCLNMGEVCYPRKGEKKGHEKV